MAPTYADDWAPYADGVADFYPDVAIGRDNGVAYWGQFGLLKVQAGVFDGETVNSAVADKSKLVYAGRLTFGLLGEGDRLLLQWHLPWRERHSRPGCPPQQTQDSKTTFSIDGLMEKKLSNLGAVTVEAEYMHDNGLTAATPRATAGTLGAAYLFPQVIGVGKLAIRN